MDGLDTTSPFLPLPEGLVIASLAETNTHLVVRVACRFPLTVFTGTQGWKRESPRYCNACRNSSARMRIQVTSS